MEESKKEIEKIFEINSREKTFNEIIAISNKLKDLENINITKFSNIIYSEFKSFKNKVNDFDNYLNQYEIKIDKKYEAKKHLLLLRKKVYEDVCMISSEKYKNFKNKQIDIKKYKKHFIRFLKEESNNSIIDDIIKMFLFIKDFCFESKFYEKSNSKDFFEKLKNQMLVAKIFSEDSLKKVLVRYFLEANRAFELINIKINNNKIHLLFSKQDFIEAKNNLDKTLEDNKIIFDKEITDKYQNMEKQYDKLINDFNNGNFKSYKKSIEETANIINEIKEELKVNLNNKFDNFIKKIMEELKFIAEKLEKLNIEKDNNANNTNIFKSVDDAEEATFMKGGMVFLFPLILTCEFLRDKDLVCLGTIFLDMEIYGLTFISSEIIAL